MLIRLCGRTDWSVSLPMACNIIRFSHKMGQLIFTTFILGNPYERPVEVSPDQPEDHCTTVMERNVCIPIIVEAFNNSGNGLKEAFNHYCRYVLIAVLCFCCFCCFSFVYLYSFSKLLVHPTQTYLYTDFEFRQYMLRLDSLDHYTCMYCFKKRFIFRICRNQSSYPSNLQSIYVVFKLYHF